MRDGYHTAKVSFISDVKVADDDDDGLAGNLKSLMTNLTCFKRALVALKQI